MPVDADSAEDQGHLTPSQTERYRRRQLTGSELLTLDRHLEHCGTCGDLLQTPPEQAKTLGRLRDFIALDTGHLDYEQKEALLDGKLFGARRAAVEQHLDHCRRCREDMEGLREARHILIRPLAILRSDVAAPAARRPSFRWYAGPGFSLALGGAMAAAVLAWAFLIQPLQKEVTQWKMAQMQPRSEDQAHLFALQRERDQATAEAERIRQETQRQVAALQQTVEKQKAEAERQTVLLTQQNAELSRKLTQQSQELQKATALNKTRQATEQAAIQQGERTGEMPMRVSAHLLDTHKQPQIRGGAPAFGPTTPAGTVVASDRPTLRWNPRGPSDRYEVVVRRLKDGSIAAQSTDPISGTFWTLNKALERGQAYTWQVFALTPRGELQAAAGDPQPRFEVMPPEALRRYLEARTGLAIIDAQNGLYDSAEATLKEVADADAEEPASRKALQLLESLRKQRAAAKK